MFLNKPETRAPVDTLKNFHHDLLLNFNEETLFDNGTDRTFSNINVGQPFPVLKPKGNINLLDDRVISLLKKKKEYISLLESKRKGYKYDLRNIEKIKIGNNQFIYLQKHLVEFYKHKDPDKYFHCDYNYYFTGGTLDALDIAGNTYLIYPDLNNKIFLLDARNYNSIFDFEYDVSSTIHNIQCADNSILIREKNALHILNVDENKKALFKWKYECKVPLLDAKLESRNVSQLGIIWANGNFNVNDIETNRTLLHYKSLNDSSEETCDTFQQFCFSDNNVFLMDRYKIKILDMRTKSLENTFDPKLMKCNTLCNLQILDNSLLLSSRHYIMKSDIRFLESVSCYSHTLDTAPCYMDTAIQNEDVYLVIAGQKHDTKVLYTGKSPYTLPYKVPDILETLESTMHWDPTLILYLEDLEKRLNYSIAGLKVLNLDGNISIFTSNSLGEIFNQQVFEENVNDTDPLKFLSKWLKSVEIPEPTLHLTMVEEMSEARFVLNKEPIEKNLERYKKSSKADEFLAKFEPRYNRKNVNSNWALKLLSIWDDSDDTDEEENVDNLPEVPSTDKVEGWIQENEFLLDSDQEEV